MTKTPPHPYLVLAAAIFLPGCGQVLNRQPMRGLMFLFFIAILGAITMITAPPQASLAGHLAGGLFVYALSIPDAYRTARLRRTIWSSGQTSAA
ncbi:MAG: hypothetical protein ACOH2H_11715 [Cypionkella sp.]